MKMKAEELRIGNLISVKRFAREHSLELVDEIISVGHSEIRDAVMYGYKDWNAEPIPLTKKWLIKFGFEKADRGPIFHKKSTSSKGRSLEFILGTCLNGTYSPMAYTGLHEEIRYVHQLQNLYYALTGQELTIKETV